MANSEHLAILKQGVKFWNAWRQKNANIRPNLCRAKLNDTNLEGVNLKDTNLEWTNFNKANMSYADLSGTDLCKADLRGTILKKTNLEKADLRMKSLFGIDFQGANLTEADLTNSDIKESILTGADFSKANLTSVDLSNYSLQSLNFEGAILAKAKLDGAIFTKSNLKSSNLTDASLIKAELIETNLENAVLKRANLTEANLSKANCIKTDFIEATLLGSNFCQANLIDAKLMRADLRRAKLKGANLNSANLYAADLSDTDLTQSIFSRAYLNSVRLSRAKLIDSELIEVDLSNADLNEADLSRSNLKGADLKGTSMNRAVLTEAHITAINLWGTARDDWQIDHIGCDYVFWDYEGKNRIPKHRDFKSGEFEELYKHLPKIEFIFEHGLTPIDAIVMDCVVQAINERHPEFELKLDSFHSRGQPHAVFAVLHKDVAEEALNQIKLEYEARIAKLEGQREALERCFCRALEEPRTIIKRIEMGDTYEIKGQIGAAGPGAHAHDINFNQVWSQLSQDFDLSKLSEQLSELRLALKEKAKALEQDAAVGEIANAEAAAKMEDGPKVLKHLQKAGKWAFDVARDIGTDVAAEVIKKSLGL